MNPMTANDCKCTNCPGADCQCGCQAAAALEARSAHPAACNCGAACGCESAEQGCNCH